METIGGARSSWEEEWVDYMCQVPKASPNVESLKKLKVMLAEKIGGRTHGALDLRRFFRFSDINHCGKVNFVGFRRALVTFGIFISTEVRGILPCTELSSSRPPPLTCVIHGRS